MVERIGRIGDRDGDGMIIGTVYYTFLDDGRVVLNSPEIMPDLLPLPLRLVGREGQPVRAFGTPFRMDAPTDARPSQRLLSRGGNGTLWSAPLYDYHLLQWDTLGNKLRELRSDHLGLPGLDAVPDVTPRSPRDPPPDRSLNGIAWDEEQGVLWVSALVPHEDWRERLMAWRDIGWSTIEERFGPDGSLRQTLLEAWDPEDGKLLASKLLNERWRPPMGPGIGLSYASSPEGYLFLDVWKATLAERSR